MRLKKLSLIAAAGLVSTAGLFAATATITNGVTTTNASLSANITVGAGSTLTIDTPDSFTFQNKITGTTVVSPDESSVRIVVAGGSGNVVKTGAGTLQIDSYSSINTYDGNTFVGRTGAADILRLLSDANQGELRIKEGAVVVSGYINQYIDAGIIAHTNAYNTLFPTLTDSFAGYSSTVLEGTALLDFQNTPRNIPIADAVGDGQPDRVTPATQVRLNFVNNLKAGDNNDQNQTRLNTGDDDIRLIVNVSAGVQGGVGYLTGAGRVYKTGAGEFKLLNDGTFSGDMMIAGGTLTLASAGGQSLGGIRSLNMITSPINIGSAYWGVDSYNGTAEWKPQYVPDAAAGTLNIVGTQTVHNLQAFFDAVGTALAEVGDTSTSYTGTNNFSEPYAIGRGQGSKINIAAGSTLILQQDLNGFFAGNITDLSNINDSSSHTGGGDIIKKGAGTLVLYTNAAIFQNLTIAEGSIISNVQALGSNTVTIASGAGLRFVQNDVGSLNALINGDVGGALIFGKTGSVTNIDGKVVAVGNGQIGSVDAHRAQTGFSGTVVVQDGLELILSAPGGDTFPRAGIRLITGTNGEESRLSFANTNQTFRELSGDAGTRVDLGRGTATLIQDTNSVYSGKVTGTGGLIKDGVGTFVLNGRDSLDNTTTTYGGATTVRGGTLVLAGANQIRNTSGLILANGGTVDVQGKNQTFGALFGGVGSTLAMGSGTLTIGLSDTERLLLAAQEASAAPNAGRYFGTGTTETISSSGTAYNDAATRAYLQSIGITDAGVLADLSFAGKISGTGTLTKQGLETLTLTGVSDAFRGATVVNGGTLRIGFNSLLNTSSLTVAAPATLAVLVNSGSETFNTAVTGAGSFRKDGAGELVLGDNVTLSRVIANGGTLTITRATDSIATAAINAGATLNFNPPGNLSLGTVFTGAGTLKKSGAATLTLANAGAITGFTGGVFVTDTGTLVTTGLASGDIRVDAGATYRATLTGPTGYNGQLSGLGTVAVSGGSLALGVPNTAFKGTLSGTGTTISAGVNDALFFGALSLTGSTFTMTGTNQTLAGLAGDDASVVSFGAGDTLTLRPTLGKTFAFSGRIDGGTGTLVKEGEGTISLTTFVDSAWSGQVLVNDGVLDATAPALSNALVTLSGTGTLALRNDDIENSVTYGNEIRGAAAGEGVIGKTGVGTVVLTNPSTNPLQPFSGTILVSQGTLELAAGALTGALGSTVEVLKNAIFQIDDVNVDNARAQRVIGDGSLALSGANTLTLTTAQTYSGNTILRNGATLDLNSIPATPLLSLNGLGSGFSQDGLHIAGSGVGTHVKTGSTLTINQETNGVFDGRFDNAVDLTIAGSAKLYLTDLTNVGDLTVSGGNLQLDSMAGKNVLLANDGTLYFDTTGQSTAALYNGIVTGEGNVVKSGTGDLTIEDLSVFQHTGGVGVDQGRLTIRNVALDNPGTINRLITLGAGELALDIGDGPDRHLALAVSGTGKFIKTGAGKLVLGDENNPYTVGTTGEFIIEGGKVGGFFTTSGALTVAGGGTLSPGNSPGTVTVNGNFTSQGSFDINGSLIAPGVLDLELTSNPANSDKIVVNGAATLAAGTQFKVTQFGAGALVRGTGYTVLTATGGIIAQDAPDPANNDFTVDLSPGNRRVLIVTPTRNADTSSVLFGKGSANAVVIYDAPSLAGFVSHAGLGGLIDKLDGFIIGTTTNPNLAIGKPINALGGALAFANAGSLDKTVNALSPLGYASLYAMTRDTGLRHEDRIEDRLEQRRYDNAGYTYADWEAFVVGSAAMVKNSGKSDTPTFDYNTYGGLVGLDKKVQDGLVVGGAAGYDNGTATLHDSAGKMEMNRVRGTAFVSTMVSPGWFVDGGLSAGFGDFTSKRDTVLGRATGSTTGFDLGANVRTGTIIALAEDLHLTPFVGVSYAHNEFQGFTEKGAASALKVNGWSQDSLRASVGSGLGWWLPSGDWKWKLGVDASYNHELLDTDSKIDASFASLGGGSFSTKAAALPSDSISVGPNAALHFDEVTSVSAGVTFEYGFDGRTFTGINVAFRRRF